jgi:hypothetical protein
MTTSAARKEWWRAADVSSSGAGEALGQSDKI